MRGEKRLCLQPERKAAHTMLRLKHPEFVFFNQNVHSHVGLAPKPWQHEGASGRKNSQQEAGG